MAKEVVYKDDLTGEEISKELVGGNPTFVFEWEGQRYAVDLGLKSREKFTKALQQLIDAAHPATEDEDPLISALSRRGGSTGGRKAKKASAPSEGGIPKEKLAEVRAWLQEKGWKNPNTDKPVGDVGRIPEAAIEYYEQEVGPLAQAS
jgi:hypothetical protein